jgi:hypothetical protein
MSISYSEKEFDCPSSIYRAKPFWAWNGKLEEQELCRQIRIFSEMGFGGFFMHSRVGLETPYLSQEWFDLVGSCIQEAGKNGLEAWLYDEDRWPSGAAGGLLTKNPSYRSRFLMFSRTSVSEFQWPKDEEVYVFGAIFEDEKLRWYRKLHNAEELKTLPAKAVVLKFYLHVPNGNPWFNGWGYLDALNAEAVREFIKITHDAYRQHVGEHFGTLVPGIFTDEPNHGTMFWDWWSNGTFGIPWTGSLPECFRTMFGYDLIPFLPEIVFDLADGAFSRARYHYHCCKSRMFAESFMKQVGQWCDQNKLVLTGHVLLEEPVSSVCAVGSAMQSYPYMQAPGIDMLGQYQLELIAAKQCSSVARQMGKKWVLTELYGCTGWDTTFETYKHSGDWQAALGFTMRCPHLSWYTMAGEAKRDYPASIHFHSPWWKQYGFVETYFSRLNVMLTEGKPICDLLVIHPLESYYLVFNTGWKEDERIKKMDQEFRELVRWLLGMHLDFDFADEHLLIEFDSQVGEDADGPFIQVGQMKYRAILVPPVLTLRKTTISLLKQFAEMGGKVVFAGSMPRLVDALPSDEIVEFAESRLVGFDRNLIENTMASIRRVDIVDETNRQIEDIIYQLRKVDDNWVLFMVNTNRKNAYCKVNVRLNIDLPGRAAFQVWDAANGKKYRLQGRVGRNDADFEISLPASGSRLVLMGQAEENETLASFPQFDFAPRRTISENKTWDYSLEDYNVMVLDRPACRINTKEFEFSRSGVEILALDREIRDALKMPRRGGAMKQPWVTRDEPLGTSVPLTLTYEFMVRDVPDESIYLAMEQHKRWSVSLNDSPVESPQDEGWWVDPSIRKIRISPRTLLTGKNKLVLTGLFDRQTDLEAIFLLGAFGVQIAGAEIEEMTCLPKKLKLGNWVDQGLAFYSGNVTYRTDFSFKPEVGTPYFLEFGQFEAVAIEVMLNGRLLDLVAWPDYAAECTEALKRGDNRLEITLLGSRRNSFGPLHLAPTAKPEVIGPFCYVHEPLLLPLDFQKGFNLKNYGLYASPVLREGKTIKNKETTLLTHRVQTIKILSVVD